MSEMIERAVKAIDIDDGMLDKACGAWATLKTRDEWSSPTLGECVRVAIQAALPMIVQQTIEAMREPTEAMQMAGFRANVWENPKTVKVGRVTIPADKPWKAMIDESLK